MGEKNLANLKSQKSRLLRFETCEFFFSVWEGGYLGTAVGTYLRSIYHICTLEQLFSFSPNIQRDVLLRTRSMRSFNEK